MHASASCWELYGLQDPAVQLCSRGQKPQPQTLNTEGDKACHLYKQPSGKWHAQATVGVPPAIRRHACVSTAQGPEMPLTAHVPLRMQDSLLGQLPSWPQTTQG